MIHLFQKIFTDQEDNLRMLLEKRKLDIEFQDFDQTSINTLHLSKLLFAGEENVFCHTEFTKSCLHTLQKMQIDLNHSSLFSAVCRNGSLDLFNNFFKDNAKGNLSEWGSLYPIHIASAFYNYEIIHEFIKSVPV